MIYKTGGNMKKIIAILIVLSFIMVTGCANYTQRGAGVGAGAGTIASVIAGKSGKTSALLILGGALLGGVIGNSMDEQEKRAMATSRNNPNKKVMLVEESPSEKTNCRKVSTKTWKDGKLISEETREECTGKKTTHTY